jgi:hypothetical protein
MEKTFLWTPLLLLMNLIVGPMAGLHMKVESSLNLPTSYITATKCQHLISIVCWTYEALHLPHMVKHHHSRITRIYTVLLILPPSVTSHGRVSLSISMALSPIRFHVGWTPIMKSGSVPLANLSIILFQTPTSVADLTSHPIKNTMQKELVATIMGCVWSRWWCNSKWLSLLHSYLISTYL